MLRRRNDAVFQNVNSAVILGICALMLAPMIHLLAVSLSDPLYARAHRVGLWPRGFSLEVYNELFGMTNLWRGLSVSVIITLAGTVICLALTSALAFALSRPQMPGRRWLLRLILFSFIFPAPLIPSYLVVKSLGMLDTLWSLFLPGAVSAYFVFIMRAFFQGISKELIEAAKIDGCSEFGVYGRVVAPLSKAVLATVGLFQAVGLWNSYFSALIYIRTPELQPLQLILRNMVLNSSTNSGVNSYSFDASALQTPEMIKAGIIVFTTIPILLVYPFVQKHFVKGALFGSLKE